MARALIAFAQAQLEAEAQENARASNNKTVAGTKKISPVIADRGPTTADDGDAA
jgi:hypothetical protein